MKPTHEEVLESLLPGFREYKKREEAAFRTIRDTSYDDDPAEQPFVESPRLDAYLERVQKECNETPESLTWDHLINIAQAEGVDVVEKLIRSKGMDPKDFWGDEQELDLDEIHRHLDKHPVLRLLSYDEVNRGLDRLWKIIEIISLIEDYLLDNENPTLPLPESGSDTEVLESYVWNHKRRWAERDTTIVKNEEIQKVQKNVEIFDAFFEMIRAVPFPEEQMGEIKHLQQQREEQRKEVTTETSSGGGSGLGRFSASERRVLALAQEEAKQFNHNYIGTEHILLGLLKETEGVVARLLSGLGVDLSKVRSVVEFIIGRGEKPVQGEIGLTPRANKAMELAVDEARRMNHTYIGTEHLLIGLLREGEGVAAGVLESQGVTLEKVRSGTHRL